MPIIYFSRHYIDESKKLVKNNPQRIALIGKALRIFRIILHIQVYT